VRSGEDFHDQVKLSVRLDVGVLEHSEIEVADDGSRAAFLKRPSGREVMGNAAVRLSSPPVTTFTGPPEPAVRIGAISI
jgi:hypothetical protein